MLKLIIMWGSIVSASFSLYAYERTSFHKIILSPELFEGRSLYVAGYFVADGESCLVLSNDKDTAVVYREYEMIRFCVGNGALVDKMNKKYGSVSGVFSISKCGNSIRLGAELRYLGCFQKINKIHGPVFETGPSMPPPPEL